MSFEDTPKLVSSDHFELLYDLRRWAVQELCQSGKDGMGAQEIYLHMHIGAQKFVDGAHNFSSELLKR